MKNLLIVVLLLGSLPGAYAGPRQLKKQQQAQKLRPGANRPLGARVIANDAILGFYINQFQQQAEVTPEIWGKILPALQQFVQARFEISQRRTKAMNQLRQTVNRNGPDDELKRLTRELDAADADSQSNQEKFLNSVDPFLTPRQQAKVRLIQNMADARLRQYLDSIQNPNATRPNAAPAAPQD